MTNIPERVTSGFQPGAVGDFIRLCEQTSANDLGNLIAEYVNESEHSGWDGFNRHDMTGIRKFLKDVVAYHNVEVNGYDGKGGRPDHFKEPGFNGRCYFTRKDP